MAFESDKTMFEIYREKEFNRKFKVVFYTELTEHNKEFEINSALNGETVFDGFIRDNVKENGKTAIMKILEEMNSNGEPIDAEEIRKRLTEFLA
ncbi:MAG: hypothetical protein JSS91_12605 [Bacteroidetes bacterium]|nr:hypothetical protein [Bacteroidota bacterium]